MENRSLELLSELISGPLVPPYSKEIEGEGIVAVVATPFNCYLDGDTPDASNQAMADLAALYAARFNVPFVGQREQVEILRRRGIPILAQFPSGDGERVESQRLAAFQAQHILPLGRKIIRIGVPEHLGRCVALDRYFGLDPVVPAECADIPYDGRADRPGAQRWCLSRPVFTAYEKIIARPGSIAKLLLRQF